MGDKPLINEDKQIIGTAKYPFFQKLCNEAGYWAIKEAKDKKLPLTYVDNGQIVKEYADGRKEILGTVAMPIKLSKRRISIK